MNKMIKMINILMITMMIKTIIMTINNFNKKKNNFNNIECGFNNKNNKKINWTLNFMYVMIFFILFDIELVIMIPLINNMKMYKNMIKLINLFMIFMMMSTMIEIKNKKLWWNK